MELSLAVGIIIEAIAPVYTEKTDHRKVYPHADSGRPLDLERIEITDVRPSITAFEEYEGEDR